MDRGDAPEAVGVDPVLLRDQLFELWTCKNLQMLALAAHQGFSQLAEPLQGLLTILEGCPGKQKGRSTTLGHTLLMEFEKWLKRHPQVNLVALSEQQAVVLQRQALSLLTDPQSKFTDCLLEIYQLQALEPSKLRLQIIRLQALNCYREAALLGMKLRLQNELNMEEMCIPLILQDKLSMAESFVTGSPPLEQQLVLLLDSWCHPSFTVEVLRKQYPRLSTERIQPKIITKHVFRLMEKFHIDEALCPNSLHRRRFDSLRFLMYKTFGHKTMTEENWSDHVQSVVADDRELQLELVRMLVKYCGLQKAASWSLKYNIPRDRLPFGLWDVQQARQFEQVCQGDSAKPEEWEPPQAHCQKFYQLPLSRDQVQFVDTVEGLQRCRDAVLKEGGVVGVDMEWRANFGCGGSTQRVALIQLAVLDEIFLLDLCASGFCQHQDTVAFIRTLFSERKVLKLGYGMAGDLKCLLATWPQFSEEPLKLEGVLDLLNVHQAVQHNRVSKAHRNGPKQVSAGAGSSEKGLSLLVQQVLGRPVDKSEQLSNWEKRPLRINQIRYAAVDAYCLLDVFTTLSSNPAYWGLPGDLRSISIQSEKSKDAKQKEKLAKQRSKQTKEVYRHQCDEKAPDGPPLAPQQLRVVCDNMLEGLGRQLRCLGVDVLMLKPSDNHREAAQLAQAEGRIILTCGQPYQTLRSQVGEGRCLSLDCSEKARDQAVRVLRHFNVQPTANHIFSRCQVCNGDEYMALPRDHMAELLRQRGFLEHTELQPSQQEEEESGDILSCSGSPDLPRYVPQCRWAPLSALDPHTLTFPGGAHLQLHTVPPGLLPRVPLFYICTSCGKVFWEGSHLARFTSQFQDMLSITDEAPPPGGGASVQTAQPS